MAIFIGKARKKEMSLMQQCNLNITKESMNRIDQISQYVMECKYMDDTTKDIELKRLNDEYLILAKEYIGIIYKELCSLVG